jgi:uncharacterized protein YdaU (DUF1376 family)
MNYIALLLQMIGGLAIAAVIFRQAFKKQRPVKRYTKKRWAMASCLKELFSTQDARLKDWQKKKRL